MSEQSAAKKKPAGDNKPGGDKPGVYFNGFAVNNTLVDFQMQLSLNGNAIESFNMAPITAKNLALQLLSVIDKYEMLTGSKIEAFNELKERTQEKMKQQEELKKEREKEEKKEKKQEDNK